MANLKSRVDRLESTTQVGPNALALVLHKAKCLHNPALPEVPLTWSNTTLEELLAKVRHGDTR